LFVWGDRDRLVPAAFSRHVVGALPDAGSIVMEDCGHVPQFEHPAETAALVRGFVESVPPAVPRRSRR
jgi:pimeloyl-ACP methyl ester carboxylesterase